MNELKSKFNYGDWGQQFCPPFCFEFSGKALRFVFDGYEASAEFLDDKKLKWNCADTQEETEYWCLKAADYTYMLSFSLAGNKCMTLIIDKAAGLVTLDVTTFDKDEKPVKSALDFGAIAENGKTLPAARHEMTKDLAGNAFRWVFCDTYWHVEAYTEDEVNLFSNYPDVKGISPYTAVKISDTMYYSCNGDDKESFCVLMNISHLTCVARSVIGRNDGKAIPLGAVGEFEV